jgi:hypothetical protein
MSVFAAAESAKAVGTAAFTDKRYEAALVHYAEAAALILKDCETYLNSVDSKLLVVILRVNEGTFKRCAALVVVVVVVGGRRPED